LPFKYVAKLTAFKTGKQLAVHEMRATVTALLRKFEFNLLPGFDAKKWEHNIEG
jgi:hypothetical protein